MQGLEGTFSCNTSDYVKEGTLSQVWEGRGRVLAATYTPSRTQLAIKIFDLEKCTDDFDLIQHEACMLREVRHPNLLFMQGSLSVSEEAWLLLPQQLCSVAALLHSRYTTGLPELAIAVIIRDVLLALQYLHSRSVIHRGVQARHILLSTTGRAVLSGLRHSIHHRKSGGNMHQYPRYPSTLLNWASPEMLHQDLRGYSYPSDVYSLGLTTCEMGNAEPPYQHLQPTLMMVEKLRGLVPFLHDASNTRAAESSLHSSSNSLASNGGLHLSTGGEAAASSNNCSNNSDNNSDTSSSKVAAQQQRHFTAAAHQFVRRTLALDPHQRPTVQQLLTGDTFVRQAKKAGHPPALLSLLHLTAAVAAEITTAVTEDEEEEGGGGQELENSLSRVVIHDTSWSFEVA